MNNKPYFSINNCMRRKLTVKEIVDIYYSMKPIIELQSLYTISKTQIRLIKKKKNYRKFLEKILDEPGWPQRYSEKFIKKIFLIPISQKESKRFHISWDLVKRIKERQIYSEYTKNLGEPGELVRYGLTEEQRREIYWFPDTAKNTAFKYNISASTVWNIRRKHMPMPKNLSIISKPFIDNL